jgi:cation:H+ antiporter|tara:strand:- start:2103 stop:3047 length:945 start_codon:yes stop_codon:yes gene_type:complete
MNTLLFISAGLILLYIGGEMLVKGSVAIAVKARISKLVVGMTVVSFATSAPELFVSLKAIFLDSSDIVFGNVIGSNIANIALVLSLTSIIVNIDISKKTLNIDYPFLLISSTLIGFILFYFNSIPQFFGVILLAVLFFFLIYMVKKSRIEQQESNSELTYQASLSTFKSVLMLIFGILLLKFGADFLVKGAIDIAEYYNISERVIAVTIIAIGTSIPELVTSIIAALRKEVDLAVGNIVGSNLFNLLAVLGTTALFKNIIVSDPNIFMDYVFMLFLTVVLGFFMYFLPKEKITRLKGIILLLIYITYLIYSINS